MARKVIYRFASGNADGNTNQKALLGGKGANLAEMAGLGIPVRRRASGQSLRPRSL